MDAWLSILSPFVTLLDPLLPQTIQLGRPFTAADIKQLFLPSQPSPTSAPLPAISATAFATQACVPSSTLYPRALLALGAEHFDCPPQSCALFKLAGTTDRRTSTGGFLNRVFGSSKKEKDGDTDSTPSRISTDSNHNTPTSPGGSITVNTNNLSPSAEARKSGEEVAASPTTESKKRRSSSAKAKDIFTQAKNSLIHGDRDGPQTPMQKLSKTDAALSVPQGSLNNSAGESQPTPNSSFVVGVTEDKNKKCRRTMEDTHSYLYNFLGTPAPVLASSDTSLSKKSSREGNNLTTVQSDAGQHVVETDNGYFAIFDGHAGTFAAEWCGKKLHIILEDLMRKYPNTPVPELLDQTYTSADTQLEKLPLKNSGCTAITAVLRWEDRVPTNHSATGSQAIASLAAAAAKEAEKNEKNNETSKDAKDSTPRSNSTAEATAAAIQEAKQKATRQRVLYTANVGDARIVLCRNGKALRLSYDHKGMDENEGRRITKAGGLILNNRVNGVLAVTRALGDSYLKDLVTGHPYTTETVIQPDQDEFLILACDGLWDVCSDQEAVDLVRGTQDPQAASKALVDHALARFSTDNLSVMIVRFDPQKLQTNTKLDIGVETGANKDKTAISEVEMIVGAARRSSNVPPDGTGSDQDSQELIETVIKEQENEDQEPGPELTPEGRPQAERILSERKAGQEKNES
ncbi:mgpp2cl-1, protein phosphatase 2C-like protein 1 [Cladophialophora chaetospira]|uniref:Mgpp2cl-1, protein phosphatase 2C-like protein 1 n=1 Tax=Cladophialophora chaetospira TaxID=386627 RepID=A0AA38WZW6_9EURO|nr:mgpp2cl-1, protein phosphatase 2C-like protein 1 [Cladophialophora chaetospira]